MRLQDRSAVEALIVAMPKTARSALYGLFGGLSAIGTLWQQLVGSDPLRVLIPQIVSLSCEQFWCGSSAPSRTPPIFQSQGVRRGMIADLVRIKVSDARENTS